MWRKFQADKRPSKRIKSGRRQNESPEFRSYSYRQSLKQLDSFYKPEVYFSAKQQAEILNRCMYTLLRSKIN